MPKRCIDIRSVFEYQFLEFGAKLQRISPDGSSSPELNKLATELDLIKHTLRDKLTESSAFQVEKIARKLTIDPSKKDELVTGWHKIELEGSSMLEIKLSFDSNEKPRIEGMPTLPQ